MALGVCIPYPLKILFLLSLWVILLFKEIISGKLYLFFFKSVYIKECTSDFGGRQDHELKKLELYFELWNKTSVRCWQSPFPILGLSFFICSVKRGWGPPSLSIHDPLDCLILLQLSQVCLSKQATSCLPHSGLLS